MCVPYAGHEGLDQVSRGLHWHFIKCLKINRHANKVVPVHIARMRRLNWAFAVLTYHKGLSVLQMTYMCSFNLLDNHFYDLS